MIEERLVQLLKAASSITVTESGRVKEVKFSHASNEKGPIVVIEDGNVTEVNPELKNKQLVIVERDAGSLTEAKLQQP